MQERHPILAELGAHSPYLSDLARREPDTLAAILRQGPDAVCDAALLALSRTKPGLPRREVAAAMRQAKRHIALATALADIGGVWSLEQVTGALSDLADTALRLACVHLLAQADRRGELRLPHPGSPDRGCGFCVLGMGKLGAHELNYSSDVDLILLYDPAALPGDPGDLGPVFARMARDLAQLMEARDSGGYVFRVDLRLRPDPASTPPAIALPGALAYYESQGQTWERAALIKARPVAGDIGLGRRFLDAIRPFIWRRHLDFAALADIADMKRRIDAHKGTALAESGPAATRLLGHDLKLGQGGIREIEFCAQALQLVWGGRAPALRVPATLAALHALAGQGHLPADDLAGLEAAYRFLRRAEHRLQMAADRQIHSLPASEAGLTAFAAFMGFADAASFAEEALSHLLRVLEIFDGLFAAPAVEPDTPRDKEDWGRCAIPPRPPVTFLLSDTVEPWLAGRPRALRTERDRALVRDMLPAITAALARQSDPAAALARLDEFIYRLPAGVQVFSLLHHNPALLDRLAETLGAAPALADHLASFPASLEGLVSPQAEAPAIPPSARLAARLADARALDDAAMIAARMVRADEFAIATAEFFGRIDVDQAAAARTALADATMRALAARAMAEHVARYGTVAGGGMAVVALGKAGSGEMMAGSDLDLLLIYDHASDATASRGPRALAPSQYFARAAQGFVAALTLPTRHGPLYAVDMRLRPSGSAGPVAVSLSAFIRYHAQDAWTWERLALTRARVVTAPAGLRRAVQQAIAAARQAGEPARVLADTRAMRVRMQRDQPVRGVWDVRRRAGGLLDVEFVAQALQLVHAGKFPVSARPVGTAARLAQLARLGALPCEDAATLARADRTWRCVQSLLRIGLGPQIPASPSAVVLEKVSRATGFGPDEAGLLAGLDDTAAAVRAAFVRSIGEIESA